MNNKWFGTDMLFIYAIVADIIRMIRSLGSLTQVFGVIASFVGLVAIVMLVRDAIKHESTIKSWVLAVIFVLIWWFSAGVSFV